MMSDILADWRVVATQLPTDDPDVIVEIRVTQKAVQIVSLTSVTTPDGLIVTTVSLQETYRDKEYKPVNISLFLAPYIRADEPRRQAETLVPKLKEEWQRIYDV